MKTYAVALTKTVVVEVQAETPEQAVLLAIEEDSDADGSWSRAEPDAEIVNVTT